MQAVGRRIRQERRAIGLRQEEAAAQLGISGPFLSQVETGKRAPAWRLLESVCRWRGRDLEWLLFGDDERDDEPAVAEDLDHYTTHKRIRMPVVGRVAADPASQVAWEPIDPPEWRELPAGAIALEVEGDSMRPLALPGQAVVAVEESVQNGDLAAVEARDGRRFFKRLWWLQGRNRVILESIRREAIEPPVVLKVREIRRMWRIVGVLF